MVNCLKQIAQFGIDKQIHVAGTQQELESLAAMPPEARVGVWMFEWYWKQPNVPALDQFVADIRKRSNGKVPTARTWFGFTSLHSFALVANEAKTLDGVKLAQALGDFELPPEVKLQPNKVYYRKGDHQLMTSAFVGGALTKPAGIRRICSGWIMSSPGTPLRRPSPRRDAPCKCRADVLID